MIYRLNSDLAGLNVQQLEAVRSINGFVEIVAGAGTGKTHTIVCRAEYLVVAKHVDPSRILMITFTKKAAKEIRDRIGKTLGPNIAERMNICTFHVFCNQNLRKYANLISFGNDFEILPPHNQKELMADIWAPYKAAARTAFEQAGFKDFDKNGGYPSVSDLLKIYGDARNKDIDYNESAIIYFDDHPRLDSNYVDQAVDIIRDFNERKKIDGFIDYDDMLWYMRYLLLNYENVRAKIDAQYEYIMCDEYQDTNTVQDRILSLITQDISNLCVIGDENQAIYAFRGANIENIRSFARKHSHMGHKRITLYENYRSSQEILDVANAVINHASYQTNVSLHGQFSNGYKPELITYWSEDELNEDLVRFVQADVSSGVKPKDIAIMGRTSNSTNGIEILLRRHGISFKKYGGVSFFERAHIVSVLSLMKAYCSVNYVFDWRRSLLMCRGVGEETAKVVYDAVLKDGIDVLSPNGLKSIPKLNKNARAGLSDLYDFFVRCKGTSPQVCADYASTMYHDCELRKIDNSKDLKQKEMLRTHLADAEDDIHDLILIASDYSDFKGMFEDLALSSSVDDIKGSDDECISVTTVHSAKGLEYHSVYLVGALDGIFPSFNCSSAELDEDLRCMYVALTRAKRNLMILLPNRLSRGVFAGKRLALSQFLNHDDVLSALRCSGVIPARDVGYSSHFYDDRYSRHSRCRRF